MDRHERIKWLIRNDPVFRKQFSAYLRFLKDLKSAEKALGSDHELIVENKKRLAELWKEINGKIVKEP